MTRAGNKLLIARRKTAVPAGRLAAPRAGASRSDRERWNRNAQREYRDYRSRILVPGRIIVPSTD